MGGLGAPEHLGQVSGWSRAPIAARLPAIGLVALVGLAAVIRPTAPFVFAGLLFIYVVTRRYAERSAAIAAVLPAAAILAWRSLPQPLADPTGADCTNLLAPPAVWRFLEGLVGLVTLVLLVLDRKASFGELGFRRGSRQIVWLSVGAIVVIAPIALYAGTIIGDRFGGVFFGSYQLDLSQPAAFLPAIVFAASNAFAEELAYRGAMRVWLGPSLGVLGANVAQSIVFGLSHTGGDFVGVEGAVPTALAMVAVAFVGGIIARRTRSLTLPIAVHIAADIPIYFYWACRLA